MLFKFLGLCCVYVKDSVVASCSWNINQPFCVIRQVDMNSKNVFGQPRLRASLRDLRSPRRTYKSTIEDDLKKLIIMDNPGESPPRDPVRNTLRFSKDRICEALADSLSVTSCSDLCHICPAVSQTDLTAHFFRWVAVQRAQRGELCQLWEPDGSHWCTFHLHAANTQTRHLLQPPTGQEEWVWPTDSALSWAAKFYSCNIFKIVMLKMISVPSPPLTP